MQTTTYRSTDGGQNFIAYKGAPGGDDYHVMWIDPQNSQRMILGVDQGATISLDAGLTWSSWYNQPTGQFYHVITDNQFPYVSYAPQQDSGTAAVPNRSDYGEISYRDWFSIGGFEFCYIAPDPTEPRDRLFRRLVWQHPALGQNYGTNRACLRPQLETTHVPDASAGFFAAGPAHALSRRAIRPENHQRRR